MYPVPDGLWTTEARGRRRIALELPLPLSVGLQLLCGTRSQGSTGD